MSAVTIKSLLAWVVVIASATVVSVGQEAASTGSTEGVDYLPSVPVVAPPMNHGTAAKPAAGDRFWQLQLNLCNSGEANCYTGGNSVYEGGNLIRTLRPNVVTLNEICSNDLPSYLVPSLRQAWPDDWVYYVFVPAINKNLGVGYRCRNGYEFGNAVLGRVPAARYRGVDAWGGRYLDQDRSAEQRTFACAYAVGDHLACATHLTSHGDPIAMAQCRALLFGAVPHIRSVERFSGRTVVGGDLNLNYSPIDPENVQTCVPGGTVRKGDGGVQHVFFSDDVTFAASGTYALSYTDHNAFLVKLAMP
jgi:hypothetical protein